MSSLPFSLLYEYHSYLQRLYNKKSNNLLFCLDLSDYIEFSESYNFQRINHLTSSGSVSMFGVKRLLQPQLFFLFCVFLIKQISLNIVQRQSFYHADTKTSHYTAYVRNSICSFSSASRVSRNCCWTWNKCSIAVD